MRLPARLFSALSTLLVLSFCAVGVSGQIHPPMAEQRRDAEKEAYYARFSDLKRIPSADHQRRAYEAAREYLKRFEGDKDADAQAVRKFVAEYEKQSRDYQVYGAFTAKNYLKTFELGRKVLETIRSMAANNRRLNSRPCWTAFKTLASVRLMRMPAPWP